MLENSTPAPAGEIPAGNPQNEPPAPSGNAPENSRFEKILAAGDRVFTKFGIKKPGRGRPRKDGQPKKSDIVEPLPGEPVQTAGNGPVAPAPVDCAPAGVLRRKIFVAGCVGILKGAVGWCKKWVRKNAAAAKINPDFTEKAITAGQPEEADFKEWGDALEVCAEQYGWDFEHMPAVTLGVKTIGIFAPFAMLAKDFREEIARQRAKDENRTPGAVPAATP